MNPDCQGGFSLSQAGIAGLSGAAVGTGAYLTGKLGEEIGMYVGDKVFNLGISAGTVGDIGGTWISNQMPGN